MWLVIANYMYSVLKQNNLRRFGNIRKIIIYIEIYIFIRIIYKIKYLNTNLFE